MLLNEGASVFCDNEISPYEMTIYTLAMAYSEAPLFDVDSEMINDLSQLLMVDKKLLECSLSENRSLHNRDVIIQFGKKIFDCNDFYDSTFFAAIIRLRLAYKSLYKISDRTDEQSIKQNISLIRLINSHFDVINASISTYECMLNHHFSYRYTVFNSGDFPPVEYLNKLIDFLSCKDCIKYDESILSIISHLAQYELRTRLNALYLIVIIQIIMHSPFFEENIHKIAIEMYEHLMFIFRNGRIISIQVNSLFCDSRKKYNDRTKMDNTTRLQILYGFENFDAYVMRVDLSHQGQPFIHFNNSSPGKVCSYIFTKEEYEKIVMEYPSLKSCFIEYNSDRWALKERCNCKLTKELSDIFDKVEAEKSHKGIFSENFTEDCVVMFIELLAKMLPSTCLTAIDKEGEYARRCFNYDTLIRNTRLLYLAYIKNDLTSVSRLLKDITNKAVKYGLIAKEEIETDSLLFLICLILNLANEQAKVTP